MGSTLSSNNLFMLTVAADPPDHIVEANGARLEGVVAATIDSVSLGRTVVHLTLALSDSVTVQTIAGDMAVTYQGPYAYEYPSRYVERICHLRLMITPLGPACLIDNDLFPIRRAIVTPNLSETTAVELFYTMLTEFGPVPYLLRGYLIPGGSNQ